METVAFFAILARLVQVQVPALRRWPTQRSEGGIYISSARPACVLHRRAACSKPAGATRQSCSASAAVHGPLSAGPTGSDTVRPGQRELRIQTQALERESLGRTSAVKEREGLWEVHEQLLSTSAALHARLKEVTAGPHSGTSACVPREYVEYSPLPKNTSVWRCSKVAHILNGICKNDTLALCFRITTQN